MAQLRVVSVVERTDMADMAGANAFDVTIESNATVRCEGGGRTW